MCTSFMVKAFVNLSFSTLRPGMQLLWASTPWCSGTQSRTFRLLAAMQHWSADAVPLYSLASRP